MGDNEKRFRVDLQKDLASLWGAYEACAKVEAMDLMSILQTIGQHFNSRALAYNQASPDIIRNHYGVVNHYARIKGLTGAVKEEGICFEDLDHLAVLIERKKITDAEINPNADLWKQEIFYLRQKLLNVFQDVQRKYKLDEDCTSFAWYRGFSAAVIADTTAGEYKEKLSLMQVFTREHYDKWVVEETISLFVLIKSNAAVSNKNQQYVIARALFLIGELLHSKELSDQYGLADVLEPLVKIRSVMEHKPTILEGITNKTQKDFTKSLQQLGEKGGVFFTAFKACLQEKRVVKVEYGKELMDAANALHVLLTQKTAKTPPARAILGLPLQVPAEIYALIVKAGTAKTPLEREPYNQEYVQKYVLLPEGIRKLLPKDLAAETEQVAVKKIKAFHNEKLLPWSDKYKAIYEDVRAALERMHTELSMLEVLLQSTEEEAHRYILAHCLLLYGQRAVDMDSVLEGALETCANWIKTIADTPGPLPPLVIAECSTLKEWLHSLSEVMTFLKLDNNSNIMDTSRREGKGDRRHTLAHNVLTIIPEKLSAKAVAEVLPAIHDVEAAINICRVLLSHEQPTLEEVYGIAMSFKRFCYYPESIKYFQQALKRKDTSIDEHGIRQPLSIMAVEKNQAKYDPSKKLYDMCYILTGVSHFQALVLTQTLRAYIDAGLIKDGTMFLQQYLQHHDINDILAVENFHALICDNTTDGHLAVTESMRATPGLQPLFEKFMDFMYRKNPIASQHSYPNAVFFRQLRYTTCYFAGLEHFYAGKMLDAFEFFDLAFQSAEGIPIRDVVVDRQYMLSALMQLRQHKAIRDFLSNTPDVTEPFLQFHNQYMRAWTDLAYGKKPHDQIYDLKTLYQQHKPSLKKMFGDRALLMEMQIAQLEVSILDPVDVSPDILAGKINDANELVARVTRNGKRQYIECYNWYEQVALLAGQVVLRSHPVQRAMDPVIRLMFDAVSKAGGEDRAPFNHMTWSTVASAALQYGRQFMSEERERCSHYIQTSLKINSQKKAELWKKIDLQAYQNYFLQPEMLDSAPSEPIGLPSSTPHSTSEMTISYRSLGELASGANGRLF